MLDIFAMHVPYNEIWLSKYITDLLSFLLEMPDYTLFTSSDNAVSEHASTVSERAISYMQQRFSSNLTMEELADHVSLNLSYFIRCFKRAGMTPHSYLISIRLQQAVYYLKTTDRTVKDIGFACGFQSENSFCITFKNHKGYTFRIPQSSTLTSFISGAQKKKPVSSQIQGISNKGDGT